MVEEKLWGDNKIPDAIILKGEYYLGNERLLQDGSVLELTPEHYEEWMKCKNSIEYFAENYYTIITGGTQKSLMKLWPIQRKALRYFQKHNRVVLNASRQTSKTTMIVLFILWKLLFSDGIQKIGLLGNKFELAKLNLKKVQEAFEDLPFFIKPFVKKYNESVIELENECLVKISSTSSDAFRGHTINSLIIDEAAFINNGGQVGLDERIMQSLMPTLDASGDDSFCILISTPYGMNNVFAKYYFKAKKFEETGDKEYQTKFKHFEILWSDHPDRDQDWYDAKVIEMGSEHAFYVEFGGSFSMGSKITRMYDNEIKKEIEQYMSDPLFTQNKNLEVDNDPEDTALKIWEYPQRGRIYVAGVDVSEGVGECSSTIEILDITNLYDIRQVAEYACNTILVEEFAHVCMELFNRYNECWATIENNGKGGGELISLLKHSYKYRKLVTYHFDRKKRNAMIANDQYGVVSHHNSKKICISNIRHFLNVRKCIKIRSEDLLREMDTFIRHEGTGSGNGTWSRENQSVYDDRVDAFNWAIFILHKNLVEDYFILADPKYDTAIKPIKIIKETLTSEGDPRREHLTIPENQRAPEISIYFGGVTQNNYFPQNNSNFLENF